MAVRSHTRRGIRDRCETRREALTRLAARQYGVVELGQLKALGYSRSDVFRRVKSGRLQQLLPRTYRVAGAPRSSDQTAMAAVLWAGEGAAASHESAAWLWGMTRRTEGVHVTSERKLTRPPPGLKTHVGTLARNERGRLRGIPVTSPVRTLLDLGGALKADELLPFVEKAVLQRLVTSGQLEAALSQYRGRRGCRALAEVLDGRRWSSALEREVANLLDSFELPPHEREFAVGAVRVDFAWPEAKVGIEADGRRWHSSTEAFARDRVKHNLLLEEGWRILRVTRQDVSHKPAEIVERTRRLLGD